MPKIFISYANDDQDYGCAVHEHLVTRGFEVISDLSLDYSGYSELFTSIDSAITQCDVVTAVLTPHSIKAAECQYEWQEAASARKPIIPLMFSPVSPPSMLTCRDYIDFTGSFDMAIKQLINKLDWFTSAHYLRLQQKMMRYLDRKKAIKTLPPSKISNAYKEFGRLIAQRLGEWGDGVEKLAKLLDIEVELAQAVLDGTMPPTTLDQEFIDEIVTLLQLDTHWVQLVFAAATAESSLTSYKDKDQINAANFSPSTNTDHHYTDSHYNDNTIRDANPYSHTYLETNTMNTTPPENTNDASSRKQGNLELLRRAIVEWSPDAFKVVHQTYGRLFLSWIVNHPRYDDLRAYAPHLTPDDILQEAYTKLHRSLKKRDDFYAKFPTIANFMAYCRTTISNLIHDQLPTKPREPREPKNITVASSPPLDAADDLEFLLIDPTNDRSIMEHQLDWKLLMERIAVALNQEEMLIFKHKIFGDPGRDELRQAGKTTQETERIWKRARRKLWKDTKLRAMLNLEHISPAAVKGYEESTVELESPHVLESSEHNERDCQNAAQ